MAKGKHSTALFEVINKPARASSAPPQVISRAPLNVTSASPSASLAASAAQDSAAGKPKAVLFDSDRHLISLRVSYTTALVALFSVVVIVTLAYIVGRGVNHGPQLANASTEDLRKGPADPAVLDVAPAVSSTPTEPHSTPSRSAAPAPAPAAESSGPIAAPANVKRIAGQNYVIMQSYPDEATAKEAQSVLLANGIPCTVDRGPQGFVPMSWYSVIGTQGFEHIKTSEFESYIREIDSVKYGEHSKFKKFDPRAYRWR